MIDLAAEISVNLSPRARILAIVFAAVFVVSILELVRRHRLQERYTVVWLAAGAAMVVGAILPDETIGTLARALGVADTTIALFSLLFLVLLGLALHLTVVVSAQSEQITRLAQDLAIERAERERTGEGAQVAVHD